MASSLEDATITVGRSQRWAALGGTSRSKVALSTGSFRGAEAVSEFRDGLVSV